MDVAQSRQHPAHGGLAQPDISRGAGDAAPAQQGFERRQEAEVEAGYILLVHTPDPIDA